VSLHRIECHVPSGRLLPDPLRVALGLTRERNQEADDRDRGLVLVLLEELPLQHLRTLVGVVGDVGRPVAEIPEDRVRLRERPAVVEDERRHPPGGIEIAENLGAIRAIDDAELVQLEREAEVRRKETHLVTVARDRRVVEQHPLTVAHGAAAATGFSLSPGFSAPFATRPLNSPLHLLEMSAPDATEQRSLPHREIEARRNRS